MSDTRTTSSSANADDWFRIVTATSTSAHDFKTFASGSVTYPYVAGSVVAHGSGFYLAPEPDGPYISAEDYAIIDQFIIDSIARGHAGRA